ANPRECVAEGLGVALVPRRRDQQRVVERLHARALRWLATVAEQLEYARLRSLRGLAAGAGLRRELAELERDELRDHRLALGTVERELVELRRRRGEVEHAEPEAREQPAATVDLLAGVDLRLQLAVRE